MSVRTIAPWTSLSVGLALALCAALCGAQQRPAGAAAPATLPPLFLKEEWRQRERPANAGDDFVPEGGVTAAAVTNQALELKLYDPDAASIPGYLKNPPPRSVARDWGGPSCIQLAGFNQNPPPERVANGTRTDPPNLWTGVCHTAVAATLRDRSSYVDLTGLARIRWVTRTSGFHVVRPVVKLADGNWFVGDYGEGAPSANSTLFLESEFAVANVRWLPLDISRVVTTGQTWATPDLSRVDEIGFADLLPGSGHGWGGFVNLGRIEVYGKRVAR
ncbi:MAG TPA: hypothetical protein VM692_01200 [Gammaproteobacteria bacterium]|nr:hypothetical protein [Gammaproteobacteria bacterium]